MIQQAMSKAAKAKAIAAAAAAAKDSGGDNDEIFYSIFPVENEELAYGRSEVDILICSLWLILMND